MSMNNNNQMERKGDVPGNVTSSCAMQCIPCLISLLRCMPAVLLHTQSYDHSSPMAIIVNRRAPLQ
jgi:hypothetical protein